MPITTKNEATSITLKYDGYSTSYSKVKPAATADAIYDTAMAIKSLQNTDKALKEVKRNEQYTICFEN